VDAHHAVARGSRELIVTLLFDELDRAEKQAVGAQHVSVEAWPLGAVLSCAT
jgi:hypothetical protein